MNPEHKNPTNKANFWICSTVAVILNVSAHAASAATFTLLTNPSLAGHVTTDPYLGNGDDSTFPGINTIGAASQFIASNGVYGFWKGNITVADPMHLGVNTIQSADISGEWNYNPAFLFNQTFNDTLDNSASNTVTINANHTASFNETVNDSLSGGLVHVTGNGFFLKKGEDPATLFSGDLLQHFKTVLPLLPAEWTVVAQYTESATALTGPFAGQGQNGSLTEFSIVQPVPLPASIFLFPASLGYVGFIARRKGPRP